MSFENECFNGDSQKVIEESIPHRRPFLFVDKILQWSEEEILCSYRFRKEEFFFPGHYPGMPLVPGVILCESAMQAGAILLTKKLANSDDGIEKMPVVGRIDKVKFKKTIFPEDEIEMNIKIDTQVSNVWYLKAKITSESQTVLTFDFAVTAIPKN